MTTADLLAESFGRIRGLVHGAVEGLTRDDLTARLGSGANSIAWLIWHLTRIQDDHISEVAGTEQVWAAAGWMERFGLPLDAGDTGYGHTAEQVALVSIDAESLCAYYDAVHATTLQFVRQLTATKLDRIVDRRWNPPVTLGVRLVSVVTDDLLHAGQAAYIRGILERR